MSLFPAGFGAWEDFNQSSAVIFVLCCSSTKPYFWKNSELLSPPASVSLVQCGFETTTLKFWWDKYIYVYIYLLIVCGKSMKSPKSSTSQSSLSRASSTCTSFWVCLVKFLKVVKQFFEHGGRQKYLKTPQQPPTGNYSNHIFSVCMYVYICVCMYIYIYAHMYVYCIYTVTV